MYSEKELEDNLDKLLYDNLSLITERLKKEEGLSPEEAIKAYIQEAVEPVLSEENKALPNYHIIVQRVEKKAYLSLLIHVELYPRIQAVRAQNFPEQEEMIHDIIQNYNRALLQKCKNLPGVSETVNLIVQKMTNDENCYIALLEYLRKDLQSLGEEAGIKPEVLKKRREAFVANFERTLYKRYKNLPNYKTMMHKIIEDIMEEKEK